MYTVYQCVAGDAERPKTFEKARGKVCDGTDIKGRHGLSLLNLYYGRYRAIKKIQLLQSRAKANFATFSKWLSFLDLQLQTACSMNLIIVIVTWV